MSQFFETICCKDGKALHLEYHSKRVYNTIQKDFDLRHNISPPNKDLLRCKVIYNKNTIEGISYFPYEKKEIKKLKVVYNDTVEYNYKYLDRTSLNALYEQKETCDDIIIVKDGLITDTSIANISIFKEDNWLTPETPLLKGTTRARLLDEKKIQEKKITLDDLLSAEKLALSNAMIRFDILQNYEIVL